MAKAKNTKFLEGKITAQHWLIALIAVAFLGVAAWIGVLVGRQNDTAYTRGTPQATTTDSVAHDEAIVAPSKEVVEATTDATIDQLLYLIEEEKLAHDVYKTMYDLYSAQTFKNIQSSELRHQASVLTLLTNRGIADPRSNIVGTFNNPDLQALYNTLIAQGKQSLTEAYKVGVLIEKTDIADIDKSLTGLDPQQTDIKAVLDSLRRGSENHLAAFSRKV